MNEKKTLNFSNLVLVLGFILFVQVNFYSQSKKKQIEFLNFKIDSVFQKLNKDRKIPQDEINTSINKNKELETIGSSNRDILNQLTIEINKSNSQLNDLKVENETYKKEIAKMRDSLKRLSPIKSNSETNIKTVKIGTQTWMAEDLAVTKYNNGDNIPVAKNEAQWNQFGKSKKGCFARLNNGTVLYNGYALYDRRGIMPNGFMIPTIDDFKILVDFLGGGESQSGIATLAMATYPIFIEEWVGDQETGGLDFVEITTNGSSNFNATMGGFIYDNGANFILDSNPCSYWWTSTPFEGKYYAFDIGYCSQDIGGNMSYSLAFGFAVRCIKD
jgi:uncharacterized protein (TIGR02145 family)